MRKEIRSQYQTDVAPYRYSSDSSVFLSIQQALNKRRSALTQEQLNLLGWNIKHAEYSFGANIEDISMVSDFLWLREFTLHFKTCFHNLTCSLFILKQKFWDTGT